MSQIFKTIQSKLTDREQLSSMLGQYQERERQLNQTLNEIELIELYELQNQHIVQIQILSRLKKILLSIPNQIEANPCYLKDCNDKYFNFIMNQINMKLNSPPESCRFLFHIVSLRIKLWFNKQEFDDIFNSFLINIDHNKKVIPFVIEFLIELIETFSLDTGSQNESFFSDEIISKTRHQNEGRTTLTRKTNNSFFTDDLINKKSFKATKQLSHSISRKSCFNKQNRFQRQFLDYELNKILSFANEMFNRSVVENSRYIQQERSQDHEDQQQLYHILLPASLIAKDLQLVHKVLTYDFFGDRKCHEDQYFNQKMPLIIPTKYSKYCQFQEFDQWIKSRKDLTKYQYIYFYCNEPKLKLIIVKILGDLLRIHQKFFKKDLLFKTHIESVLSPIKLMLQNLEIRYDNEFEIAIALGQTISKLLSNSTFPTFLNQSRNDFKRQFIGTLEEFIQKQIFDRNLLDISFVRYFLGFFSQVVQKLSINTCDNYKIRDFKEQVYSAVQRIGQSYETLLYQNQNCSENTELADYCEFRDAVDQLNLDYFSSFFSFFKYFNPRQYYKEDFDLGSKCIFVCSKIQHNIHLHDRTQKNCKQRSSSDQYTPQLSRRYCLQTFTRLIHVIESKKSSQQDSRQQSDSDKHILNVFKYKLMTIGFFIEKLVNCKVSTLMIFAEQNYIFTFTKSFLTLMFQLIEFKAKKQWNEVFIHEIRNAQSFCLDLAPMVVKLNEENLKNTRNAYYDTKQITKTIQSAKKQLLGTNFLTQEELNSTSKRLKQQFQALNTELNYFQNLLKQSNRAFDVHFEGKQSQDHKNISKGIRSSVKNKQFERVLEPIYKVYFISIEKLQFYLQKQQELSAKYKKINHNSILRFSIDTIDQDLQQDDDECTVIEEQDQSQEKLNQFDSFQFCTGIDIHDLNHIMNPISDYVFLSHVNSIQSSQLKLVLQKSFISWYQTQTGHASQQPKQTGLSITKIYSIQSIAQRLTQVYFHTIDTYPNTLARQMKFYLLRITVLLLKMFRTTKFEPQIKREILKCCEPFIWFEFSQIQQDNYRLEPNHQQFQEDRLMAERVEAVRNLLETVINVHYFEDKVNIYNQEFGLCFEQQLANTNTKIVDLQRQEEDQIYQMMRKTKITSELIDRALDFIVRFPINLLKDGYYRLIEHQLVELIKQFYFELSQFPLLYMFNLDTTCDIEETRFKVNLKKIQVNDSSTSYKKYVMPVNFQTLTNALRAYGALIPFVDQIIQLSLISRDEKWATVRNKQLLPFLKQITQFFTNLSRQPQLLQLTFRIQDINDQQLCRDQNPFPWITRHLCWTLFEFLYYFLTELQTSETSFVTRHLSLIENVYSLILTIQAMGINYLNESLSRWVGKINTIVIFKAVPEGKQNKMQGKKTSKPNEPKIIRYNGWEYVKRLYQKSQEQILEELQAYDIKFKFYIEAQQTQSQTQTMRQTSSEFDKTIYQQPESKMKSIINSIRKSGQKLREEENQDLNEESSCHIYTYNSSLGNDQFIAYDEGLNLNENFDYHTEGFEMEQKQDRNKNPGKINPRNNSPVKQENIPQTKIENSNEDDFSDLKFEQRVIDGEIQFVHIISVKSKQNKIDHSLNSTINRPTKDQFYQSHQSSDYQKFYIRSQERKQHTQNQIRSYSDRNDQISSQCHKMQTLKENLSRTQTQLVQNSSKKRSEKNSQNLIEDNKYEHYQCRQVQDDELTVYDVLPSEENLNGDLSSQTLSTINQQSQRNPQFEHIQENQPRFSFKKQSNQP